ncbi:hypothetical protein JCM1840_004620 [Sporobolomyces johnsonii]
MTSVSLPPASSLVSSIRSSCASCRTRSNILINEAAVDTFILSIPRAEWEQEAGPEKHGVRLPLRFDSPDDELNLLSVLALLNFLSGYRPVLHRLTSRGAYSTILSLVLSAYLASDDPASSILSTQGMLSATPASIAALAQIQTHQEKDHPTLGSAVKVGLKDEEAWECLELIVGVLKETGEVLKKEGKGNLGQWVSEKLVQTQGDSGEMVKQLAETFPAFRDAHLVDGEPVYLFKKALWLLTIITLRFSSDTASPPPFPLPKIEDLPVFADNVLPTLLVHLNILTLASSTDPALSSLSLSSATPPLLSSTSATRLRAAALDACASIVRRAHALGEHHEGREWLETWTEQQLDGWLWGLGKRDEFRSVERVAERGTVYY